MVALSVRGATRGLRRGDSIRCGWPTPLRRDSSMPDMGRADPESTIEARVPQERSLPPIFVGGTGRSGTTILGRLLGEHHGYSLVPIEAKFHCQPDGIPGYLRGEVTAQALSERLLGPWFTSRRGRAGLEEIIDRS